MKTNKSTSIFFVCVATLFLYACEKEAAKYNGEPALSKEFQPNTSNIDNRQISDVLNWKSPLLITKKQTSTLGSSWGDMFLGIYFDIDKNGNNIAYWQIVGDGQSLYYFDAATTLYTQANLTFPSSPNNFLGQIVMDSDTGNIYINWHYGNKYLMSIYTPATGWSIDAHQDR